MPIKTPKQPSVKTITFPQHTGPAPCPHTQPSTPTTSISPSTPHPAPSSPPRDSLGNIYVLPGSGSAQVLYLATNSNLETKQAGRWCYDISVAVPHDDRTPPVIITSRSQTVEVGGDFAVITTICHYHMHWRLILLVALKLAHLASAGCRLPIDSVPCAAPAWHQKAITVHTQGHACELVTVRSPPFDLPILLNPQPCVQATSGSGATATFIVKASDAVDPAPVTVCEDESGGIVESGATTFPLGVTLVICSATDDAGNFATANFTVTVVDTTSPAIQVPTSQVLEASGPGGAEFSFSVLVTDRVDMRPEVTCGENAGKPVVPPSAGPYPLGKRPSIAARSRPKLAFDSTLFPLGRSVVTCTATDASGNAVNATFVVTVVDTTPPTITALASQALEASSATGAPANLSVAVSDRVDSSPVIVCRDSAGRIVTNGSTVLPMGRTAITCTATDTTGNAAATTIDVTVADTTPPALVVPGSLSVEATGPNGTVVAFTVGSLDAVDPLPTIVCKDPVGHPVSSGSTTFPLGATTITCHATDSAGNAASGAFKVTLSDTTPPAISVPLDLTIEATGPDGGMADFIVTALDIADLSPTMVCLEAGGKMVTSGSTSFPLGRTVVTCTASDASGNSASGSFSVVVVDTTPPSIRVPSNQTVEATDPSGTTLSLLASATDLVDNSTAAICSTVGTQQPVTPGATMFPLGSTTVVCSAADESGNAANATFSVIVVDTTPPSVSVPANQTLEATGPSGAVASFVTAAIDAVSIFPAVSCSTATGQPVTPGSTVFPLGQTEVVCTSTDGAGNTGNASFVTTVADTTAPSISVPASQVVKATSPKGTIANFSVTASDAVDASPTIACSDATGQPVTPGNTVVPLGITNITCTATDASGNAANARFQIIVGDEVAPSINIPSDLTIEAEGPKGAPVTFTVSAADLIDPAPVINCRDAGDNEVTSGSTIFVLGRTVVTCTAKDASGNSASGAFSVTVVDTTPPLLTLPEKQVVEATGPSGAVATFVVAARDKVDGVAAVTCTDAAGKEVTPGVTVLPLGSAVVTCSAADAAGNAVSASFVVTVADTTAPSLSMPADQMVEATGPGGAGATFFVSAADAVDPAPTVICKDASGAHVASGSTIFSLGVTLVTCSAKDTSGNVASATLSVAVMDTTPPSLTVPSDLTVEAAGPNGVAASFDLAASDLVDAAPSVVCTDLAGLPVTSGTTILPMGVTLVTCTASDYSNNTATASLHVTVADTVPPVITVPSGLTVLINVITGATVNFTVTATDAVTVHPVIVCRNAAGEVVKSGITIFPLGSSTITCAATDEAGHSSSGSFIVTAVNAIPPVVVVPSNITAEASGPNGTTVNFTVTVADSKKSTRTVEQGFVIVCKDSAGEVVLSGITLFPLGVTTATCTASDAAGNSGSASFSVTVVDSTGPSISAPADQLLEVKVPAGAAAIFKVSASDLVSGAVAVVCRDASGQVVNPGATVFPLGQSKVMCSAADKAGNKAAASFKVTIGERLDGAGLVGRGAGGGERGRGRGELDVRNPRPARFGGVAAVWGKEGELQRVNNTVLRSP